VAADEFRSLNGQIEFLLRESLRRAGRLPKARAPPPRAARRRRAGRRQRRGGLRQGEPFARGAPSEALPIGPSPAAFSPVTR